jgi:hypothetical protein
LHPSEVKGLRFAPIPAQIALQFAWGQALDFFHPAYKVIRAQFPKRKLALSIFFFTEKAG